MLLIFIKTIYVTIHFVIGVYDFSFYRIPNILLGVLFLLYGLYAPFYMAGEDILTSLLIFIVVLAIGFGLFATKIIGGGDAKYIATASLWMGIHGIIQFIFTVAVVGGLLGFIYLFFRDHIMRFSDWVWSHIQKMEARYPVLQGLWVGSGTGVEAGKRENIDSRMVPYGIAIATAAIIMLAMNPLTH